MTINVGDQVRVVDAQYSRAVVGSVGTVVDADFHGFVQVEGLTLDDGTTDWQVFKPDQVEKIELLPDGLTDNEIGFRLLEAAEAARLEGDNDLAQALALWALAIGLGVSLKARVARKLIIG